MILFQRNGGQKRLKSDVGRQRSGKEGIMLGCWNQQMMGKEGTEVGCRTSEVRERRDNAGMLESTNDGEGRD